LTEGWLGQTTIQTGGVGMEKDLTAYWRKNITYVVVLLCIWALVSYVLGIFFMQPLNSVKIGGFPLGFWFANQGSEVTFVILIFVYVWLMNKLDREYDVQE
jgi:putative solute:sodium symporter small subunit